MLEIASTSLDVDGVLLNISAIVRFKSTAIFSNSAFVAGFEASVVATVITLPAVVVRFKSLETSPTLTTPSLSMSITPPTAITG